MNSGSVTTHSCGAGAFGEAYSIHGKVCGCCGTGKERAAWKTRTYRNRPGQTPAYSPLTQKVQAVAQQLISRHGVADSVRGQQISHQH